MANVLIADDNAEMSSVLAEYIKKEGYNVLVASDGGEALDIFSKNELDMVFLDVTMPVLNGYARREDLNMEQMTLRNMEMMAYNTRLSNELEKERDKVARLEEEVARLRKALGIKESEPEAPQQKTKTKRK